MDFFSISRITRNVSASNVGLLDRFFGQRIAVEKLIVIIWKWKKIKWTIFSTDNAVFSYSIKPLCFGREKKY